jgi:hypothetical protein
MSPPRALAGALVVCALVSGCGGSPSVVKAPAAPCGAGMPGVAGVTIVDLPFAPGRPAFLGWLDDRRIIVAEAVEQSLLERRSPPSSSGPGPGLPSRPDEVAVRAFVLDVDSGQVEELGKLATEVSLHGNPTDVFFTVVGGKLAVLPYGHGSGGTVAGVLVDPATGAVTALPAEGAPPSSVFLVSTRGMAWSGPRLFLWPRAAEGGVDLDAGHVLDAETGTWATARTGLGLRHNPQITSLPDGRIAVWGGAPPPGTSPATTGALFDPALATWRPFPHPAMKGWLHASSGSRLAGLFVEGLGRRDGGKVNGTVFDLGSPAVVTFERPLLTSFRNAEVLHFGGGYVGYLGAEALHLWDATTGTYREVGVPFGPNLPSAITVHDLAAGRWLFDGTSDGVFVFDPARGSFCSLAGATEGPSLKLAAGALYSTRSIVVIGGRAMVTIDPDCPPGVPCASDGPVERLDARAKIIRLSP